MAQTIRPIAFTWDQPTSWAAFAAALLCLVPTVGYVLAWHMQVDLAAFTRFAILPALIALAVCETVLVRKSPRLFNRFGSGLVGGLVATLALDAVRLPAAYLFKAMPDHVPMIGQNLLHETAGIAASPTALVVGYGFHYLLVGAMLGAAYSLIVGKGRWYWGLAAGVVVGIAFAALPQFQLLSVATGFNLPTAAATAVFGHAVAGAALGAMVQLLGRTRVNVLYTIFLREDLVEAPELALAGR